jgi:phage I-like protein
MPYEIRRGLPGCSGYAVVKQGTSKVLGCHPTREKAKAQLAALYANEGASAMTNPRTFTALAAPRIGDDGLAWVEVMPTSEKARNGSMYWTVDRADLDTLVASIASNHERIPIDYDHDGIRADGSTKAAGWFTGEAHVVEAGQRGPTGEVQDHASAWAQVRWSTSGRQAVEGEEYRFLSAEWESELRDAKTGLLTKLKELTAATLTNRPYFKNLAPVTAADLDSDQAITAFAEENDISREDLLRALADVEADTPLEKVLADAKAPYGDVTYADPGYQKDGKKRYPLDSEEHCRAAWSYINMPKNAAKYSSANLASIKSKIQAALKKYGAKVNPSNASEEDTMDAEVLKALGLDEDASAEETLAAVVEMREKLAITEGFDKSVLEQFAKTTASELQKDRALAQLQRDTAAKQHERDREDLLAKGVEQGRILPVHKDALRAVFDATTDGAEKVRAIIEAAPQNFFGEIGHGGPGPDDAPEMRQYEDKRGNRIAAVADPEWLDKKAQAILAETGKTLKTATAAEYVEALNKAQALAESPR